MKSSNTLKGIVFFLLIMTIFGIIGYEVLLMFAGRDLTPARTSSKTSYSADQLFENISSALADFQNETVYDDAIGQETVDAAVKRIRSTYPEYFWLDGYATAVSSNKTTISLMTLDNLTSEEVHGMYIDMMAAADSIISQIPGGLDDYEKALFVHDYIVNNTSYDTDNTRTGNNGLWGTAYGCLVEQNAICQGYAEAYQLILNRLGIECGVCTGDSDRGKHAWNYVRIDGQYYWVDVTWDDPEMESSEEFLMHDYFMINDELLERTRSIDNTNYYVPKCISMADNYYVRNGSYMSYYDLSTVSALLERCSESGSAEMMFSTREAFDEAMEMLFDEEEIWLAGANAGIDGTLTYVNDEKMLTLQIRY